MPTFVIRLARLTGRLLLTLAAVTTLVVVFLVSIVLTDGAGSGFGAWGTAVGVGTVAALWRGRRRTRRRALAARPASDGHHPDASLRPEDVRHA